MIEKYRFVCNDLGFNENSENTETMKEVVRVTRDIILYALKRLNF